MLAGLGAGYGCLAWIAARFLYPAGPQRTSWLFVAEVDRFKKGDSLLFRTPAGAEVNVARQGDAGTIDDFVALSSVCPHLGCQVDWEPQNNRFFCPCHNGAFDPTGRPIAGPPAAENLPLSSFPLKIDKGLLYIEVPTESLAGADRGEVVEPNAGRGPGVDPCLYPRDRRGGAAV